MRNSFFLFKKITRIAILLAALVLTGTVKGFSETEPNNSRETANTLALNSSISGSFSESDHSSDYFKLTTTSDGRMVITVSSDPALCVSLTVVSENGSINLYSNGNCGYSSYSNTITINNLATGVYYLLAENNGYGNYSVSNTFSASSLTNDAEPNDSRETAVTINQNGSLTGHLGYRNTQTDYDDYYKITTSADGKLTINVTPEETLCIGLTVISESGTINLYSNGNCGYDSHTNSLVINNLAAGTYYIRASASGYGSYTISNTLNQTLLANDAEINDSRETAVTFSQNSSLTGHLGYRNTQTDYDDYYKITTSIDGKLTINTVPDESLCIDLTVISESGTINLYSNGNCGYSGHTNSLVINNLAAGTYYIRASANGYGSYTISNTLNQTLLANDAELNDSRETAVAINQNGSLTGHLGYKNTQTDYYDYYKLVTSSDGKLTINLTPDETLCIGLTVMNETGTNYLYTNGNCGTTGHTNSLVINNLAAGTYYLAASADGYGSYTISNTLDPTLLTNDAEPNNSRETAVNITANSSITGHLGYKYIQTDDTDYYKIVTAGNINLTVAVTSDPSLCVNLILTNSDGSQYLQTNGTCGTTSHSDTMVKTGLPPGTYYVIASSSGYGSYTIATSHTFISNVDVLDKNGLMVFPNPANDEIFLSGNDLVNSEIRIYDLNGKVLFVQKTGQNSQLYKVDVSALKTGMYLMELKNEKAIRTEKFYKE